jgi:hypothetical protein
MFFTEYFTKGKPLTGFFRKGLFDPWQLKFRHDHLVEEMTKRGYNHRSPLPEYTVFNMEEVAWMDYMENRLELLRRCPKCAQAYSVFKMEHT